MAKKVLKQGNVQQMTEQERFENFAQDLAKARDTAYEEINIANEFGLGHQEIKHSAFLAHLFDPNRKQYCLKEDQGSKAYFLRLFFAALVKYAGKGKNKRKKSNSDILASGSGTGQAVTAADIEALGRAKDLQVKREARGEDIGVLSLANDLQTQEEIDEDANKRIDILLISKQEQIVFVIENKVLSTTHDDQLKRYERRYQAAGWKKVFVYLTPEGDIPQNEDGTEAVNWCVFDYAALRDVVEEFKNAVALNAATSITELKGKLKNKFIYALEDYMENIDKEVLKNINVEASDVYGGLLNTYPDLVEGLVGFYNGARPNKVANYCREKLNAELAGNSSFYFYTEEMKKFFERHGEEIGNKMRIVCQKGNTAGKKMDLWVELNIPKNASPAQQILMKDPNIQALQTGKPSPATTNYRVIPNHPFLTKGEIAEPDGTYRPFDAVRPIIDKHLQSFSVKLQQLENILKTL